MSINRTASAARRAWHAPTVSTVECRPEVTAYSGDLNRPLVHADGVTSGAR